MFEPFWGVKVWIGPNLNELSLGYFFERILLVYILFGIKYIKGRFEGIFERGKSVIFEKFCRK